MLKAAAWYGVDIHQPPQYLPGKDQALRNAVKDRADFEALKVAAKPKRHARGSFAPRAAAERLSRGRRGGTHRLAADSPPSTAISAAVT